MKKRALLSFLLLCCFLCFLTACGNDTAVSGQETTLSEEETELVAEAGTSVDTGSVTLTEPSGKEGTVTQESSTAVKTATAKTTSANSDEGQTVKTQSSAAKAATSAKTMAESEEKAGLHCTLSISCKTILDNMDSFDEDKAEVLPEDGIIYAEKEVEFSEGDSAFDVLLQETQDGKIHMEFTKTPGYSTNYIEGIHNIYEFDCGELSGWLYRVNGAFPSYGSSRYTVADGDKIEFLYTCDLGRDIGAPEALGGKQQ